MEVDPNAVEAATEPWRQSPTDALAKGKELQGQEEWEDAAEAFGIALELSTEEKGEGSPELADYYYHYGDILLCIIERTGDVFGGGVKDGEQDDQENIEPTAGSAPVAADAAEEAEDMELAWQMLEIARVAYGKAPKNTAQNQKLADVYSRLGDHSQMNDHFDQAVQDYKSALKIREQSHDLSSTNIKRVLASDMCNIARALQYSDPPDFQRALDYTKNAAAAMDEVSGSDPSVAEMRDELQEKVAELQEAIGRRGATGTATDSASVDNRGAAASAQQPSSGTTTIGFGQAPSGTKATAGTTIGFGATAGSMGCTTTIGFGSAASSSAAASAQGAGGEPGAPKVLAVKKKRKVEALPAGATTLPVKRAVVHRLPAPTAVQPPKAPLCESNSS